MVDAIKKVIYEAAGKAGLMSHATYLEMEKACNKEDGLPPCLESDILVGRYLHEITVGRGRVESEKTPRRGGFWDKYGKDKASDN